MRPAPIAIAFGLGVSLATAAFAPAAPAATPAADARQNPCTNGSFEQLSPSGFPMDWEPVGQGVGVTKDAHTGKLALRMLRTADAKSPETGLNRAWRGHSGQQGKMLAQRKGGVVFWYKAPKADAGAMLRVQVIPMSAEPLEKTDSSRATFEIPREHVGDGTWHRGRMAYDFTGDPKVKWVHFGARILAAPGELLLDDMQYVERTGPILRFGRVYIREDEKQPGRLGLLKARLDNIGDRAARNVRVNVACPAYLTTDPAEAIIPALAPGDWTRVVWKLQGTRDKICELPITATVGEETARTSLGIAPKLTIQSGGPTCPVAIAGGRARFECVLRNEGTAIATDRVLFYSQSFPLRSKGSVLLFPSWQRVGGQAVSLCPGQILCIPREGPVPGDVRLISVGFRLGSDSAGAKLGPRVAGTATVLESVQVPPPAGHPSACAGPGCAVIENARIRMVFRRRAAVEAGSGQIAAAEILAKGASGWHSMGWIGALAAGRQALGTNGIPLLLRPGMPEARNGTRSALSIPLAFLSFKRRGGRQMTGTVAFQVGDKDRSIAVTYELTAHEDVSLRVFRGAMLEAGARTEAVFPGLEWVTGDEVSSSSLDIHAGHPHRDRFAPHPSMVTIPAMATSKTGTLGLLWDVHQKWHGTRTCPIPLFDSPGRHEEVQTHGMGLSLPNVPEHASTAEVPTSEPYMLKSGDRLRLSFRIYADGQAKDALSVIDEYIRVYGLPKPRALPHGSWDGEIEYSMKGYLKSLWDGEERKWWTSIGGHPVMSKLARPRSYVMDLMRGVQVTKDEKLRKACLARAQEVKGDMGVPLRLATLRWGRRADLAMAGPSQAAGMLAARREDGTWRFDADHKDQGVFKGRDYSLLGPDDAVEVGTCARPAYVVLRYACIAGDWSAYERMTKTLVFMERFRVPRAAQVWEIPVHSPDILAAADAVDAYMEAYLFSGEKRWLDDAVLWARRGLPFVYLWDSADEDKPWLLGATIPVFGATWYRGSWFGRPVQWNGLRYANALLTLAEHDKTLPWKRIAELIIRSAVWQQEQDPEHKYAALWQDWVDAIGGKKCHWKFAPRQIIRNILKLTGRDEDPRTTIVGEGRQRLHVTTMGEIAEATWHGRPAHASHPPQADPGRGSGRAETALRRTGETPVPRQAATAAPAKDGVLSFAVTYREGEDGVVLVSPVARPAGVTVGGREVPEKREVEVAGESCWRYDAAHGFLTIRVARAGRTDVAVKGAVHQPPAVLPEACDAIAFDFARDTEGWSAQHDIEGLSVAGGALAGRVTAGDPYIVRPVLRVPAAKVATVRVRMRLTAGQGGNLYWTTRDSPQWGEDKVVRFAPKADGKWHEYVLPVGKHAKWAGTITALRIDPGNAAPAADFGVDFVHGAGE